MNTETGQIYRGEAEIRAAMERGEPLRELTQAEIAARKSAERDRLESGRRPRAQGGRSFTRCPRTGLKLRG